MGSSKDGQISYVSYKQLGYQRFCHKVYTEPCFQFQICNNCSSQDGIFNWLQITFIHRGFLIKYAYRKSRQSECELGFQFQNIFFRQNDSTFQQHNNKSFVPTSLLKIKPYLFCLYKSEVSSGGQVPLFQANLVAIHWRLHATDLCDWLKWSNRVWIHIHSVKVRFWHVVP